MIESLKDKNKTIALVGASNDPTKYGNKILLNLKSKGFNVIPVNNKEERDRILASIATWLEVFVFNIYKNNQLKKKFLFQIGI